jgi:hypothetical protein
MEFQLQYDHCCHDEYWTAKVYTVLPLYHKSKTACTHISLEQLPQATIIYVK